MTQATSNYLNRPLRTELEVATARADAVTDEKILREARYIERHQIQCSHDALFSAGGPMLARYRELGDGARPSGWAIIHALESQPEKSP